ncbi:Regulator of sigma E protease [Thalassovita gelatinovora]|uniref:Zinc metalloprotease n=1 Tax=Thalassovita gelatinovora TaxID=53501 RepID=A0A0P1FLB2_THAGE|nr:RIP metalloprotease RseP [Thalassovita gelatinovora]QIZ79028.1 RIP metalloprotease RseP [Thalassovita gelatinovora]CUH68600.1 Regulator of sigma E protease [Thalassovita gelatinovora]SEQ55261.1 regulator of sigma E protease [Thalassovita gelatinovora]
MDIISQIPIFGGALSTLLAFVAALSVIVAVHEYGHYIVGRWSGIKAEVFSLGFGPVLFSRVDKRGTRWQLALLPFGGYVKFLGDANAASVGGDDAVLNEIGADQSRSTMLGAPLWARTATVAAGPVFNFILSITVFTLIGFSNGMVKDPLTVGDLHPMPEVVALQPGDELVSIAGLDVPSYNDATFADFLDALPLQRQLDYVVRRDGGLVEISAPYPMPAAIRQLAPRSAAYEIDLKVGDVITSVDGEPVFAFSQLKDAVETGDGKALALTVWRAGETLDFTLSPRRVDEPQLDGSFQTNWRIGIVGATLMEPATELPGIGDAVLNGISLTWDIVRSSLSGLYHIITGAISTCNMSGPLGIAEVSGAMASQGAQSFVYFIGVLSAAVGLLNLFPIPILDGGHLAFYGYEAISGRPPSERALNIMMRAGLALILGLMLFALTNDIFCP